MKNILGVIKWIHLIYHKALSILNFKTIPVIAIVITTTTTTQIHLL